MRCKKLLYMKPDGSIVYAPKKQFEKQDDAIAAAKVMNLHPNQITKAVAYRCTECGKFHVGRNGKTITEKYLNQIKKNTY